MVDLATTLATLSGALSTTKQLIEIDRAWENANFKLEIATITEALATAQIALAQARTEIESKDQRIKELTESFQLAKETIEVRGFRFVKNSEGQPQGTPFCPVCYQEGKLLLLTNLFKPGRPLTCPKCKADFSAPSYPYADG